MKVPINSLADKVVQGQGNIVSDMGAEKVMLSIQKGKYYNLGETGGRIWELMKEPISVQQLVSSLLEDFQVDKATCEDQVLSFLSQLIMEDLIEVAHDQPTG
ncbi:lasso peptide biosynthesis PqqD family chaperone [Siminovitchia sediminis]|uniref:Lasso peptide biosynthesis PqqD family chaperone n=1 Tax=Siminovitchia sediminis TaxID=1274353 RepID=A0ABW4KP20_9BACI